MRTLNQWVHHFSASVVPGTVHMSDDYEVRLQRVRERNKCIIGHFVHIWRGRISDVALSTASGLLQQPFRSLRQRLKTPSESICGLVLDFHEEGIGRTRLLNVGTRDFQ